MHAQANSQDNTKRGGGCIYTLTKWVCQMLNVGVPSKWLPSQATAHQVNFLAYCLRKKNTGKCCLWDQATTGWFGSALVVGQAQIYQLYHRIPDCPNIVARLPNLIVAVPVCLSSCQHLPM